MVFFSICGSGCAKERGRYRNGHRFGLWLLYWWLRVRSPQIAYICIGNCCSRNLFQVSLSAYWILLTPVGQGQKFRLSMEKFQQNILFFKIHQGILQNTIKILYFHSKLASYSHIQTRHGWEKNLIRLEGTTQFFPH